MDNGTVTFQKEGSIGIITLHGPIRESRVTAEITAALAEIRKEVGYDSDISVLLLTGHDDSAFSMDTDGADFSSLENREERILKRQAAAIVGNFDRPTIAAINGDAFDQGLELALACDMRIASENAHFGLTHVERGGIPWDGGTQRLSRLVGKGKALEMVLLGAIIDAAEAKRIGLVTRVVPAEELVSVAREIADALASKGPIALRYAKEAILKGMDMTLEQGLRMEADLYFLLHTTEDRTEGINAYREKRDPHFKGK